MATTTAAATARRAPTARVYYAESASNPGTVYVVVLDWQGGARAATCNCQAGVHGRPCRHKVAAIEADDLALLLASTVHPAAGGGWVVPSGAIFADRAEAERVVLAGGGR